MLPEKTTTGDLRLNLRTGPLIKLIQMNHSNGSSVTYIHRLFFSQSLRPIYQRKLPQLIKKETYNIFINFKNVAHWRSYS